MGKTKLPPTLAARVRYVRGLVPGLPMRTLSKLAGLSQSMVGEIERGNRVRIEGPTAEKLARVCGGSVAWLLDGDAAGAPNAEVTAARLVKEWGALPPPKKSGPKGKEAHCASMGTPSGQRARLVCTRPTGRDGDHVGHGSSDQELGRWTQ